MPSTLRRTPKLGHAIFATLLLAVTLTCTLAARASASEGSRYGAIGQYGEVTRFGGFDSTWFDGGKYDGSGTETTPAEGKFIDPVGFAVDTEDKTTGGSGTAVYVLDRVSGIEPGTYPAEGTQWRLQKLVQQSNGALEVAGITEFYLPSTGSWSQGFASTGVEYLAVDDMTKTVSTLLYTLNGETPTADEVIDWSTETHEGKLVPAGATHDSVSKPASGYQSPSLLSSSAQITGADLYDPIGITVDGADDLAIAAQSGYGGGTPQGPVVVQSVSATTGVLGSTWSSSALSGEESLPAEGIFTTSAGELDVVLARRELGEFADLVELQPDLTAAEPKVISSEATEEGAVLNWLDVVGFGNKSGAAPITELSNGLYASSFSDSTASLAYWEGPVNDGIQLVQPESDGLLSSGTPPLSTIFDTLGNAPRSSGACSINDTSGYPNSVVLAAGANGAVWVLTQGRDTTGFEGPGESTFTEGRELIEMAPRGASTCVAPSGTFAFNKEGESQQLASNELQVSVGSTVEFTASTIAYPTLGEPGAIIYAYEWAPLGVDGGYTIVNDTPDPYYQPAPEAKYKYETPGVYTVALKLLGDFGEYDEDGTVDVRTASPPTAAFSAPASAQTGQSVSFNASGSAPASGAQISDYHWSFGDGQSDDTQSPTDSHTYTTQGTYTVTLTVHDSDEQASAPATYQIVVTSPPSGSATTTTTTTSTTITPVATADRSPTNVNPRVTEVDGALHVTLSCPVTKISCAGTIEVRTATAVAARKSKKSVLTLGTATFALAPGGARTLVIKLSAKGAALLKKDGTLKVDVIVAAHDSYGDPLTKTLILTLRKPAVKKTVHKK
jgi:PKD repeat protein